jgi:hypothetical protein
MQQEQARLTGLQSLGLTLSIEEQYQQSLRLSNSLMERGIITAEERARANQLAAIRSAGAWAQAAQNIAGTLAGAFSENKAFSGRTVRQRRGRRRGRARWPADAGSNANGQPRTGPL